MKSALLPTSALLAICLVPAASMYSSEASAEVRIKREPFCRDQKENAVKQYHAPQTRRTLTGIRVAKKIEREMIALLERNYVSWLKKEILGPYGDPNTLSDEQWLRLRDKTDQRIAELRKKHTWHDCGRNTWQEGASASALSLSMIRCAKFSVAVEPRAYQEIRLENTDEIEATDGEIGQRIVACRSGPEIRDAGISKVCAGITYWPNPYRKKGLFSRYYYGLQYPAALSDISIHRCAEDNGPCFGETETDYLKRVLTQADCLVEPRRGRRLMD